MPCYGNNRQRPAPFSRSITSRRHSMLPAILTLTKTTARLSRWIRVAMCAGHLRPRPLVAVNPSLAGTASSISVGAWMKVAMGESKVSTRRRARQTAFAPGVDVTGLSAWTGGLVADSDSQLVNYYSYSGALIASIQTGDAVSGGVGYSAAGGADGVVFEAGYPATGATTSTPSVEEVTPSGVAWTWTSPAVAEGGGQTFLAATPDGGVILNDGSSVWSISSTGQTRWAYTVTSPGGTNVRFVATPLVDTAGQVVIPYNYENTSANSLRAGVGVDTLSQSSGASSTFDIEESTCSSFPATEELVGYTAVAIGPGQLYLGLQDGSCSPFPSSIQAFSLSGLGADYRVSLDAPPATNRPPTNTVLLTAQPTTQTVGSPITLTAVVRGVGGNALPDTLVTFGATSGPDAGRFAALSRTNGGGIATTIFKGVGAGADQIKAWLDINMNGVVDPGEAVGTTTVTWQPTPVTVLFIQGISSSSTCADSPDFAGHLSWYRSSLNALVGPGSKYIYYGYRSPHTSQPLCAPTASHPAYPQYAKPDACWSIDDVYTDVVKVRSVPNGGEATRLANFLTSYFDVHPSETISIVAHSEGGVLATYTIKQKLNTPERSKYLKRIHSIVTLDSPLAGINSLAPAGLSVKSDCPQKDRRFDSSYDMGSGSAVIGRITDSSKPKTRVFTVDANPGSFAGVPLVNDAHSRVWWEAAHIQVASPTHGDVWSGNLAATAKRKLVRFTACAVDDLASDCTAYANS